MSGIGRKLGKLRRNPRLFVYDLVASSARGGGGPASWLLGKMVGISADAIVALAAEQSTIGPLRAKLAERVTRYGATEMRRATEVALGRIRPSSPESADTLCIAMGLAFDDEDARAFLDAQIGQITVDAVRSLVISYRDGGKYGLALRYLEHLPMDATTERMESALYRAKLETRFRDQLAAAIADGVDAVRALAVRLLESEAPLPTYHFLFASVFAEYTRERRFAELVTSFGEKLLELSPRDSLAVQVADAHVYRGSITCALKTLERFGASGESRDATDERVSGKLAQLRDFRHMLEDGFEHEPAPPGEPFRALPGQVLFTLHHSAPFHSNGYATRAHGLLTAINERDWNVVAATRMGYPHDLRSFAEADIEPASVVDGVEYLRIRGRGHNQTPILQYLTEYADALLRLAVKQEPEIIHAHSNALNGMVAPWVARALGISSIYEVRGLWEVTRASRQPVFDGSEYFRMLRAMEVSTARDADAVICITEALADEMVRCGVDRDKISVVPNGVDVERFVPRDRDTALEQELGLAGKRVIGYVGSLVDYEGLDDLLTAVSLLIERGVEHLAVLIVGDGASLEGLQRQVERLGLDDVVTFTGRVPHAEVERYYSLVDIAPFPRKSLPVTEMVSPLKPFEAMAMDKIVVASDVAALREVIDDGQNGFLFSKDDVDALADSLERALAAIGAGVLTPREWVKANRSWQRMAERLDGIYSDLVNRESRHGRVIDLRRVDIGGTVSGVMDTYRERLEGADHLLRRDDFARFSLVLDALDGGSSLLDVGVGAGQLLNVLARHGGHDRLRGVDVDRHPELVALDDAFEVDVASIAELPYEADEFDVVTCLEVIEHLDDAIFERGIAELRRVCARQLVITVPFRERVLSEDHKRRFDVADLERLFPAAELTIMRKGNSQLGRPTYWAMIVERQST